ncbi:MAG: glutamate---cysteine ligase / carboxylate-amine ligase [Gaiellales bacterium]|jgi:carboxylate-amine ligase|nr:glutamate---cysteine ligase / carboxylate-amine ligase [Gaiellales bacterium]MDX6619265.1 glutamate---cysteine ligase / carboxylate-amine ligase [Gaiellales bacterium]
MGQSIHDPLAALDDARELFARSQDLTLAIEEEFQIVDPDTHNLVNRFTELKARADATPLGEHTAGELIASEIELKTGRCETFSEAARALLERRRALLDEAEAIGVALAACGTHPWSPWWEQEIIDTPHYRIVEGTLRYVAWRNNTFGIHIHVGVRDADRALALNNAMRSVLPDLLALSASSPWYEGRYTHLHSTRTQLFTRMFPRCGIPEPFDGWADYDRFVRWLVETKSIREHTEIWWCVRPHQSYGTIELRNADALADVRESLGVMAYAYALSARRLRAIDEGEPLPDLRGRHIEENMWRAIRWGLSGELIDYERGMASVPAAQRVRGQLADAAPEIAALGLEPYLEPVYRMLESGNSAQRSIAAIEAGTPLQELFSEQVRVTRESVDAALAQEIAHG